jgi:hypothetical protein
MHALATLINPSLPGNTSVIIVSYDCMGGRSSCTKPPIPGFMLQMEGHFCDFKLLRESHSNTSAPAADIAAMSAAIWKDYFLFFILWHGVRLSTFGASAINGPIVLALYDR